MKVYQNNKLLHQIDLGKVENSYEIEILGKGDKRNIILVEPNKISVKESSCSDLTCIEKGPISANTADMPIICLPNNIIIVFESAERSGVEYDVKV